MATFLLETTTVKPKKPIFNYNKVFIDGLLTETKKQIGERVTIELDFISCGNTSDFSEKEIMILIMDKLNELKK